MCLTILLPMSGLDTGEGEYNSRWVFTHQLGYQKSTKSYETGAPGIHTSTPDGRLVKRTFRQSRFFSDNRGTQSSRKNKYTGQKI